KKSVLPHPAHTAIIDIVDDDKQRALTTLHTANAQTMVDNAQGGRETQRFITRDILIYRLRDAYVGVSHALPLKSQHRAAVIGPYGRLALRLVGQFNLP